MDDRTIKKPSTTQAQLRVQLHQNGFLDEEWRFTDRFRIGRDPACALCLDVERVSRMHAEIVCENGQWWVHDLGSKNGTFLNGGKIEHARLGNPSTLQVAWNGPILQITLEDVDAERAVPTNGRVEPVGNARSLGYQMEGRDREEPLAQAAPRLDQTVTVSQTIYRGQGFLLPLLDDWTDQTVHILTGPVTGGIQHNITINTDRALQVSSLVDYVDWQLRTLATQLKGYRLLKKGPVTLDSGMPAYRVIYRWHPAEQRLLYQEQLYVLYKQTGYKLTATFTKKTRKTLGPAVERMMWQFTPMVF